MNMYTKRFFKKYKSNCNYAFKIAIDLQATLKDDIPKESDIERALDLLSALDNYLRCARCEMDHFEYEYGILPEDLTEDEIKEILA